MLKAIKWLFYRVISGGDSWISDCEVLTICSFYFSLSANERAKLLSQLSKIDLVQRAPNNKVVQFFEMTDSTRSHWGEQLKLEQNEYQERVYRVRLISKKRVELQALIFVSLGYFTSIDFEKLPGNYNLKEMKIQSFGSVLHAVEERLKAFQVDIVEISLQEAEVAERNVLNE